MTEDKAKVLNILVREVFNGVVGDDFMRYDEGKKQVVFAKEVLMEDVEGYAEEARIIKNTRLWPLLKNCLTNIAVLRIAHQGKDFEDSFFGKALLYELDVTQNILEQLSKVVVKRIKQDGKNIQGKESKK